MKTEAPPRRRRPTPPPPRLPPPEPALPLPEEITRALGAVRSRSSLSVTLRGLALLTLAALALGTLQVTWDFTSDLDRSTRAALLAGDVLLLGGIAWLTLLRPLRHPLTDDAAALALERRWPDLRSRAISAVQLARGGPGTMRGSTPLVARVLAEAAALLGSRPAAQAVDLRPSLRQVRLAGVAALAVALLAGLTWPRPIPLVQRLFLADVPVPRNTQVEDLTGRLIVPVGSTVRIAARARGVIPELGRLTLRGDGPRRELVLRPSATDPAVFEQSITGVSKTFTYEVQLNDGSTGSRRIEVVAPPSLLSLDATQVFPAYTARAPAPADLSALTLLAGSELRLAGSPSLPLDSAEVVLAGVDRIVPVSLERSGRRLEARFTIPATGFTGFSIRMVGPGGIIGETATFPVEVVPDAPPRLEWLAPAEAETFATFDESPVASVRADDDFAVSRLTLHLRAVLPEPGPEAALPLAIPAAPGSFEASLPVDFATTSPAGVPGTTFEIWFSAEDNNVLSGPGTSTTTRRLLRVVTREQKLAALRERLGDALDGLEGARQRQRSAGDALRDLLQRTDPPP